MPETSIGCTFETKEKLKNFMDERGHETFDAALRDLLANSQGQGRQVRVVAPRAQQADDQETAKLHQPLSYLLLQDQDETMTYFTGLTKDARAWVIPKLEEKVGPTFLCHRLHDCNVEPYAVQDVVCV
jgi:hypothetical protein